MISWEYEPGPFVAVVAGSTAVLVDVQAGEPLTRELLDCLNGEPSMEDVVEVLLGQGLRRLGGFAAASVGPSGVRVVVRGEFSAHLPGEDPLVGSGLWTDHTYVNATQVSLVGVVGDGASLPVGQGIVLAASIAAARADAMLAGGSGDQLAAEQLEPAADGPLSEILVPTPALLTTAPPAPEPEHLALEPLTPAPLEPVMAEPEPAARTPQGWPWQQADDTPAPSVVEELAGPPTAVAEPAVPVGVPGGLLIESFPWAEVPEPDRERPARPAPARLAPARPAEVDAEAMEMTVDRSRLIEHAVASPSSVLVVAARCPAGHLSPAYADGCRVCHRPIPPQQPVEVPRPQLGVLRLSNGDTVALDRGAILGRNPRLPAGYSGEQPNLVRLADPGKDISGQHLEVVLDYWHVLVTDLGSTNGTEVILPGQAPIQLRPDDPLTIEPGTRVVLAGIFDFVFEVAG